MVGLGVVVCGFGSVVGCVSESEIREGREVLVGCCDVEGDCS